MSRSTGPTPWRPGLAHVTCTGRGRSARRWPASSVSPKVIADYRQALDVYRPSTTPDRCHRTAQALGDVLFDQERWSDGCGRV